MTALFHFEDKIHCKNLTWAEAIPLLFPRLISQVLEHLGFPAEPQLERRRVCEAIFTVEKWPFVPNAPHLPLINPRKDQPEDDHPVENQSPPVVLEEEPQIPVSTAPSVTVSLPASPSSFAPIVPPIPSDSTGPSTSAPPCSRSLYHPLIFWPHGCSLHFCSHFSIFRRCPCRLGRENGSR